MIIKGIIKKGEYFDSVSLMKISKEINNIEGIIDSSVVMGTKENKSILESAGLFIDEFKDTDASDLLISLKAENERIIESALKKIDEMFKMLRSKKDEKSDFIPKSFESALKLLPDANISLISIAGKYAFKEAMKALKNNLHIMLFSDNVSVEEELELKRYAKEKGLLVMGPDCGTAIINGVPLAFANVVNRGDIGIVSASGTGLQEVSCIISNEGAGISQAIGTGGRDVKKEIGGIMFIEGLKALNEDEKTKIIVLISKPPHDDVLNKIAEEIKKIKKPVVAIFISATPKIIESAGAICANTLESAGLISAYLSKGEKIDKVKDIIQNRHNEITKLANELRGKIKGKYIRGLFSGGTLCDEAQLILKDLIGDVYSNTPLNPKYKLTDSWKSIENTVIDLGDDEFTVGRPHPMIDFSLRKRKIVEEAKDPDVAIILFDVVLGYGANMNPSEELVPAIKSAKNLSPTLLFICSITGTEKDPQNRSKVKADLESVGVIVMPSNASASELAGRIVNQHLC